MEKVFYTYAYLREDGSPYYIGKGKGRRCYEGCGRCIKPPRDKSRIIKLKWGLSEEEAYRHEIYMIAVLGKKVDGGLLHNVLNGGDAPPHHCGENHHQYGKQQDCKVREKISDTLSSVWEISFKSGETIRVKNLSEWCRQNPDYRFQNVYGVANSKCNLKTYKNIQSVKKVKQGASPATKQRALSARFGYPNC